MSPDVIDADDGDACRSGKTFGEIQADQQGTHQTGSVGYRHGVNIRYRQASLEDGCIDYLFNPFRMESAGKFRHDTFIRFVQFNLRRNDIAQDFMDCAAPLRTETSNGSFLSPSFLPIIVSSLCKLLRISSRSPSG